jgi:hypothetical protein
LNPSFVANPAIEPFQFTLSQYSLTEARRAAQTAAENLAVTWDDVPEVYRKHLRSPEESIRGAATLGSQATFAQAGLATYGCGEN